METEEKIEEKIESTEDQSNENTTEKVSEIETTISEDDTEDITVEESIQNLSKEEIDKQVLSIDEEHKKYLLDRAKESNIEWDKIEFEDESKDIPLLSEKDRSLFITISEEYFGKELLDLYIDQAIETINQYKEMRELVESGEADQSDIDYFKTLSQGYQDSRIILASIQKSAREIEESFKNSKITEDFVKSVTLNSLHEFIVKKFRYNRTFLKNEMSITDKELEELDLTKKIDDDITKHMFVVTMFDYYLDRYECKFQKDIADGKKIGGRNNIFSPLFNEYMLNNYIDSVNTYIKNLEEKENIDVSKIMNNDLKAMEFAKACVVYSTVKKNTSYKVDIKEDQFKMMDSKLNFDNINNEYIDSIIRHIDEFVSALKDEKVFNKLFSAADYQLRHNKCFSKLEDEIGGDEENLCDYQAAIKAISERFPVVEGTNLTQEWKDWYIFMKYYETYYTLASLKNKETKEDVEYYNVFSLLFSDFVAYIYSDFITDMDKFVTETVYKKDTRPFMFGMLMNNLLLQHELGFKADIRTKEVVLPVETKINEETGVEEETVKTLQSNYNAPGIYDLAKEVFRDQYDYMVGDSNTDILLKDVDLIETRKKYMEVTSKMLSFMQVNLVELCNIESFDKPVVITQAKNKKKNHKRR